MAVSVSVLPLVEQHRRSLAVHFRSVLLQVITLLEEVLSLTLSIYGQLCSCFSPEGSTHTQRHSTRWVRLTLGRGRPGEGKPRARIVEWTRTMHRTFNAVF